MLSIKVNLNGMSNFQDSVGTQCNSNKITPKMLPWRQDAKFKLRVGEQQLCIQELTAVALLRRLPNAHRRQEEQIELDLFMGWNGTIIGFWSNFWTTPAQIDGTGMV
jgi:hypothetical protein